MRRQEMEGAAVLKVLPVIPQKMLTTIITEAASALPLQTFQIAKTYAQEIKDAKGILNILTPFLVC